MIKYIQLFLCHPSEQGAELLLCFHHELLSPLQDLTTEFATTNNPTAITPEEYFNPDFDLKDRDIGRPKEVTIRTQK